MTTLCTNFKQNRPTFISKSAPVRQKLLSAFFKGDRGGRVDDFGTQGVVKFRSLVKNGIFLDVSSSFLNDANKLFL